MTALFVPDLVSIVVVGHDNWPELEQAVRSGLEQSYRSIEVVVIDNASTDATPLEVPRRFAGSIRYIRQENCGDGGGYNRGITESRGEFIHLLDGDDVMARNMVEIQVAMLKADAGLD
ncbi:MAG: glycosyltransferase family 2 protein, partial [Betaproteobacteria bacterium]